QYLVLTLAQLADVLFRLEQHDEALLHFWESVQLAQQSGDVVGEGHGLNNVAQVEQARGHVDVALQHQANAVEVYRRSGDQVALLRGLANLAELHLQSGALDQAESLARHVVDQAAVAEVTYLEGFGRHVLGGVLLRRAEWVAAAAELTEALRLYSQVNSARAVEVRAALDAMSSEV
ncbi:tetratricopeptide repeat protein, partial [Lentzea sp. NPDC060358]|uniref:tetratricopeptide repeat protein n=1 Tax=Lentzea sp. NPDC060358 TaxID=3347103 RepID=UPI003658E462